jgi:geranylgeranylglycerol-phosphate geranylgeranyltransferase
MRIIFELIRWVNCAMAGFAALIGTFIAYSALSGSIPVPQLSYEPVIVFIVVFLITGAGNAINDYFDYKIDRINRPERPIPSGRISRTTALYLSVSLFGIGIILSYWLGPVCLFLAAFNSVLLFLYASTLKGTVLTGNVVVGYLTGSTFLFGSALDIFNYGGIQSTVILFLLAGLATIAREIVKDIQDLEGDRRGGTETLPVKIGKNKAARIAAVVGITGVVLSPLPFVYNVNNAFGISYLIVVFVADLLFLVSITEIVLRDNAEKSSKLLKIAMFVALLAFVVGTVL